MLVKKYKSDVVKVDNHLKGIYTLEFSPKRGKYRYNPGQFLHLAIDTDYDGVGQWPESRCFSMQSSPEESTIRITYAIKGQFTTAMRDHIQPGMEVWLKLPYGDLFTQEHSKINTVFIAGGTGVTPFLSLFGHNDFKEYVNPKIYIGFKSRRFNIYQSEMDRIRNPNPLIIYSYEDEDGLIDIKNIFEENRIESDYFLSGPPKMILIFKKYLKDQGVPAKKIKTDDWG